MKILFIDDQPENVAAAMDELNELGYECTNRTFSDMPECVTRIQPDIVVLDLMLGTNDPEGLSGKKSYKEIWETRFCPVIIYSANADMFEDEHPLVHKVTKGRKSVEKIKEKIQLVKPCVDGINAVKQDIDTVLNLTMRDLAPYVFKDENRNISKPEAMQYMGRRRVSAHMDSCRSLRDKLVPWEQYIIPPLDESLRFGDIILKCGSNKDDPQNYRLVLTPSCDLVRGSEQTPKVENVLCAKCEITNDKFFEKLGMGTKNRKNKLISFLNQGFEKEYIFIPGFPDFIPAMVANLKTLELVPYSAINNKEDDGVQFIQRASVDSPFREQMSWAFMNTGCRPGTPNRDSEIWVNQYLKQNPVEGTNEGN